MTSPVTGVHHLALVTQDMNKTVEFYDGVLGFELCATIAAGPMRHYFFRIGDGRTVAFFEWATDDVPGFEKEAGVPPSFPTHMDHLALAVSSEDDLLGMQSRLRGAGVDVTEVVDHGILRSIYFSDPNGIALELSYWVRDPTVFDDEGRGDASNFGDPNPVPAVWASSSAPASASAPA